MNIYTEHKAELWTRSENGSAVTMYRIDIKCKECDDAIMRFNGRTFGAYPTLNSHTCEKCSKTASVWSYMYPIYEEEKRPDQDCS